MLSGPLRAMFPAIVTWGNGRMLDRATKRAVESRFRPAFCREEGRAVKALASRLDQK